MNSRAYARAKLDVILMAVTSQLQPTSLGDVAVTAWQAAGLLKASVIKPVITTVEKRLIIRRLGRLADHDRDARRRTLAAILG